MNTHNPEYAVIEDIAVFTSELPPQVQHSRSPAPEVPSCAAVTGVSTRLSVAGPYIPTKERRVPLDQSALIHAEMLIGDDVRNPMAFDP
jgi:hypothetical protein